MSKRPHQGGAPPKLISNIEVLEFLQQQRRDRKGRHSHRHRDWIEQKVVEYIQSTPCVKLDSSRRAELQSVLTSNKKAAVGNSRTTATAMTAAAGFGLTEAESLQLVNSMPSEPVEIHLLIDELQSRMTERQQDELLVTIGMYMKDDAAAAAAATTTTTTNGNKTGKAKKTKDESNRIKQEKFGPIGETAEI